MNRLSLFLRQRRGLLALLLLFVSFRLFSLLLFRPGGFIADFSDYDFYRTWGLLTPAGYQVYENLWTAYPPLFPRLMLAIFGISAEIPAWSDSRLWFHLLLGALLLLFESGNLLLIYRLGNRLGSSEGDPHLLFLASERGSGMNAALIYALFFAPVYTLLGWFEPMPLFFMLLGLELLLVGRTRRWGWVASAIAAALGFLTKLTPALLLPIAVRIFGARLSLDELRHRWFRPGDARNLVRPSLYAAIFVGTVLVLGLALTQPNPALSLTPFRVQSIRPPWQSIWALLDGFTGYGLVPLDMRNLGGLEGSLWQSSLPWGLITLLFAALYLWLYTRDYNWKSERTPVTFAAVSVIWLFLYSKGWSPQFVVWILAFLALLLPTVRGVLVGVALTALNVIEAQIYLIILPAESWILWGTVLLRTALLILLAIEFLSQIWPQTNRATLLRWSGRLIWATLVAGMVAGLVGLPVAGRAYVESRYVAHPCREVIDLLQDESPWPERIIVGAEPELWASLNPWLSQPYDLRLIDTYSPGHTPENVGAERLAALGSEQTAFWWVDEGEPPPFLEQYQSRADVQTFAVERDAGCRLLRLVQLPERPLAQIEVEGGPIFLQALLVSSDRIESGEIRIVLYWQTPAPVEESYTVFVHLLDESGNVVDQQDNLPVGGLAPTDTWSPGSLIRDSYLLSSGGLENGVYRVHLGMYTEQGRQPLVLEDGTTRTELEFLLDTAGK